MHRIDHATAIAEKPAPEPAGPAGYFYKGDALRAIDATWMTADWANDVQENLCTAIEAAQIALQKGDGRQLLMAIKYFATTAGLPLGVPVPFIGTLSMIPSNCVAVMGQTIPRASYPDITTLALASGVIVSDDVWMAQSVHRTKFSFGDGASTIRLPDLRGESIYGADLGRGIRQAAVGDWLDGDMPPHVHSATIDAAADHFHTGYTDSRGDHNHGGGTGFAGRHTHVNGNASRLLVPPYVGSITGSDTTNSGTEQAVGPGDSSDMVEANDHNHSIPADGQHIHAVTTNPSGSHSHTATIGSAGGKESRQRGVGYIFIMRVL